jgi:methionyl-tRNA synthetase
MSCAHCGTVEQRGRFCVGCGTTLPPRLPAPRRVSLAARPYLTDDMTQPVLRLRHVAARPRVPVHEVQEIPA